MNELEYIEKRNYLESIYIEYINIDSVCYILNTDDDYYAKRIMKEYGVKTKYDCCEYYYSKKDLLCLLDSKKGGYLCQNLQNLC